MGVLDGFTPGQRQALMIGAPVVAGLGLVAMLRKKNTTTTVSPAVASTDVIGTGQLAQFETSLSDQLAALADTIASGYGDPNQGSPTPAPPVQAALPPPVSAPAPAMVAAPSIVSAPAQQIVGVAPPPPTPGPSIVYQIPNPIAGDNSSVAVGTGPYPFIYGGSQAQVDMLVAGSPPANDAVPASWGISGTWADPHYSW